jgi:hypothetical protein
MIPASPSSSAAPVGKSGLDVNYPQGEAQLPLVADLPRLENRGWMSTGPYAAPIVKGVQCPACPGWKIGAGCQPRRRAWFPFSSVACPGWKIGAGCQQVLLRDGFGLPPSCPGWKNRGWMSTPGGLILFRCRILPAPVGKSGCQSSFALAGSIRVPRLENRGWMSIDTCLTRCTSRVTCYLPRLENRGWMSIARS